MNEKAINNVISGFAIDNANLKIQVATLSAELEDLKAQMEQTDTTEEEK